MKSIREIAEYLYKNEFNLLRPIEFCESVLAAYLAQQEPFGWWHQGATDEESDFFPASYCHNAGADCSTCVPVFLAPPIKPGFVMVPVDSIPVVTNQGVQFGKHCWVSHERISGCDAEALNSGKAGIIGNNYMQWVQTMIQAAQENSHD